MIGAKVFGKIVREASSFRYSWQLAYEQRDWHENRADISQAQAPVDKMKSQAEDQNRNKDSISLHLHLETG